MADPKAEQRCRGGRADLNGMRVGNMDADAVVVPFNVPAWLRIYGLEHLAPLLIQDCCTTGPTCQDMNQDAISALNIPDIQKVALKAAATALRHKRVQRIRAEFDDMTLAKLLDTLGQPHAAEFHQSSFGVVSRQGLDAGDNVS